MFEKTDPKLNIIKAAKSLITRAIKEDCALNDITTLATIAPGKNGKAHLIAKAGGVLAGVTLAESIFQRFPGKVAVIYRLQDSQPVKAGDLLLTLEGNLRAIMGGERILLNFLQRLSGIATYTKKVVQALGKNSQIKLLDTRKTLPGYRILEKYAVLCGGGQNHRMGLGDMFLIKENHIRSAGSLRNALKSCQMLSKKQKKQVFVEVEVTNLEEFAQAHDLGADIIMLDHFTEEMVVRAARLNRANIPLELSGNIDLSQVAKIKNWPIQYISVGAITHSAPALDLSLLIDS